MDRVQIDGVIDEITVNGMQYVPKDEPKPNPDPDPKPDPDPTPDPKESIGPGFNTNDARYFQSVQQSTNLAWCPSFYHKPGDGARFGPDGFPVSGKTEMRLYTFKGRRSKPGRYLIQQGGQTTGELTVNESDDFVLVKFDGAVEPDLRIVHEDDVEREYTDTFSQRAEPASCIRYMDGGWTNKNDFDNDTPFVRHVDGPSVDWAHHTITPEQIGHVSRTHNTDGWYCVPHLADESTIRDIAKRFARSMGGRKLYVEDSNEIWNVRVFPQAKWVNRKYPRRELGYHVERTNLINRIFKEEYSNVETVFAWQLDRYTSLDIAAKQTKEAFEFDSVAINLYMGGPPVRKNSAAIASMSQNQIDDLIEGDMESRTKPNLLRWLDQAAKYDKKIHCYESGLHAETSDRSKYPASETKLHAYLDSEQAAQRQDELFGFFARESPEGINLAYMDVSSGDGRSFGLREFERSAATPRHAALMAMMA